MRRTGSLRDRFKLRVLRSGVAVWSLCERLGLDLAGATEGPPVTVDTTRREAFDELIAGARDGEPKLSKVERRRAVTWVSQSPENGHSQHPHGFGACATVRNACRGT